ncbi:type VII secretion system (T7SS), usher family protein, partial [Escherichia coli]
IGPDPRNFNQRVSLGRNDLLIRTFPKSFISFNVA